MPAWTVALETGNHPHKLPSPRQLTRLRGVRSLPADSGWPRREWSSSDHVPRRVRTPELVNRRGPK